MEISKKLILETLDEYCHNRKDREVMAIYLTDYPGSLERLAEETDLSVSTVKRIVNRNAYIYKHLPGEELKLN
jgi:predicted transcriptional regulator